LNNDSYEAELLDSTRNLISEMNK